MKQIFKEYEGNSKNKSFTKGTLLEIKEAVGLLTASEHQCPHCSGFIYHPFVLADLKSNTSEISEKRKHLFDSKKVKESLKQKNATKKIKKNLPKLYNSPDILQYSN